jgi:hypothetical protein
MARYIDPSLTVNVTPANPGAVATQEEADALRARFEREHPFAPSNWFTAPTVVGTPNGMPPGAAGDATAPRGAAPLAVGGGWGRPAGTEIVAGGGGFGAPSVDVGAEALPNGLPPGYAGKGRGARSLPTSATAGLLPTGMPPLGGGGGLSNVGGLATLASDARANFDQAQDFARNIAPYIPTVDTDREVAANNFAYLDKLVASRAAASGLVPSGMPPGAGAGGGGVPPGGAQLPAAGGAGTMAPAGLPPGVDLRRVPYTALPPGMADDTFPAVQSTDAEGRPVLTQSAASLIANRTGTTARDQARRTVEGLAGMARGAVNTPKLVNIGNDVYGRPVQGVIDRSGNMSRITPPKEEAGTQLNQLIKERDTWKAAGRKDIVDQYDAVISSFGKKFDVFGNLVGAPPATEPAESSVGDESAPNPAGPELSSEDKTALEWAQKHKEDPRAAAILQRLGVK